MITHLILGIIFAFIIWKLLKVTLKTVFWFVLIGMVVLLFFPGAFVLVGGLGFLIVGVLVTLLFLSLFGFFFLD
jgi:hypothetical protein